MNYAFRIHGEYEKLKETCSKIGENSQFLVVYEHTGGRTHIHGYVEGFTKSTDSIKSWVKKELNVETYPKTDWSFQTKYKKFEGVIVPVDRECLVYFHKGEFKARYIKGITEEELVSKYHSRSYKKPSPEGKVQYKLKSESPKEAKLRKNEFVKMCIQRMKERSVIDSMKILDIIIEVAKEYNEVVGVYKILEYYDTIILREQPGKFKDMVAKVLEKRNIYI